MIEFKTPQQIGIMREGGKINALVLKELSALAIPGATTAQLDKRAEEILANYQAIASFKGFEGYKYSLVACINDEVVHGLPNDRPLQVGDLLTLDFGTFYKGFHSDSAVTIEVGSDAHRSFLEAGKKALQEAIEVCCVNGHMGDIGDAIEREITSAGYDVVWQFVGHGVGRELHEEPEVPGYGDAGTGIRLEEGMVLAVEVMYAQGDARVKILNDGWTAVTVDGSLSGMFEHTVAITKNGPLIVTAS